MLQRGIPTSNPLTYSRLVTILCAERLNISLIVQPCQTNKNIFRKVDYSHEKNNQTYRLGLRSLCR